ncbi:MAG: malonate transporter [Rhodobacteraceae bacterium]|nr:MAG: malonate transporter [Paracoccaceae bacterium]
MEALRVLQDPILPVFAIMALGLVMGRLGVSSAQDALLVNRIAMSVFLPLMIFGVVATAPVRSFALIPTLVYLVAETVIFAAGFVLARKVFRRGPRESVLLAFSGIFSNNALYILPISVLLYGRENVLPVTTLITLDAVIAFGGAMIAMELMEQGRVSPGMVARSILRTPMLISILLGMGGALMGVTLPGPVMTFLDFNGAAAAPLALFALGVALSRTPFRADATVVTFTLVKLAVFPAAVALGLWAAVGRDPAHDLFLLGAAGPAGAMAFSMALLHGVRSEAIAQVMIYTCVLTLFSLAVLA